METNFFSQFTNKYSLSKTLRFELKPVGETLTHIKEKGLLAQDSQRAISYKYMKKTIDEYHKWFIEKALKQVKLSKLEEYLEFYNQTKDIRDDKKFNDIKTALRKEIVKSFSEGELKEIFKNMFLADLIKKDLESWIGLEESRSVLYFDDKFNNFTTYFTGFHENRKNMYSDKGNSTEIAYRIVHENC